MNCEREPAIFASCCGRLLKPVTTFMPAPNSLVTAPEQLSYQQLDNLHVLRGFCAFYVLVHHAKFVLWAGGSNYLHQFPRATWTLDNYLGFGLAMTTSASFEMVIFFFVLSGFFIRYATLRRPRSAGRFYLNRIARIYPPYLASMLLAVVALASLAYWCPDLLSTVPGRDLNTSLLAAWQELRGQPVLVVVKSLFFIAPGGEFLGYNPVYWSLLPEALFYLLVPLAFRHARWYYFGSVGAFGVGMLAQVLHWPVSEGLSGFMLYNAYFALGSWLYDLLVARPAVARLLERTNSAFLVVALLGLFGIIVGLAIPRLRLLTAPLSAGLAVLSILVLLAGRVNPRNPLVRLFHHMGLYSFSLYLYHMPLLLLSYALLTRLTGQLVSFGQWYWLFVPVVTLACYALYWITERPAVRYFRGV